MAAGAQAPGTVTCPVGTKVIGGGAIIAGGALTQNLNSSAPATDGKGWRVWVNNSGTTAGSFTVYANCAASLGLYSIVTSPANPSPAHTHSQASVVCPVGTVPLGGGGIVGSNATTANLSTSYPVSTGWWVEGNNATATATTITAFAICGKKPAKYVRLVGPSVLNPKKTQSSSKIDCPVGTVPFGGGAYSDSTDLRVNLNSTVPSGNGWNSYENNASSLSWGLTTYAICAAVAAPA